MHLHKWSTWRFSHYLDVHDDFGGKTTYVVYAKTCQTCQKPRFKKFKNGMAPR